MCGITTWHTFPCLHVTTRKSHPAPELTIVGVQCKSYTRFHMYTYNWQG